MEAPLIVKHHGVYCGQCKMAVSDQLAKKCPKCDSIFGSIGSNHVGLAEELIKERGDNLKLEPKPVYPEMVCG